MRPLFTIGHSAHSVEVLLQLLARNQIEAVADVRSHPYSRTFPCFSKASLELSLTSAGIHYVLLGRVPGAAKKKLEFAYDSASRRISKKVYLWNTQSAAYETTPATELHFLYDGWNLIAELDTSNDITRSYLWGLDLSDTQQGAGGVGGLLTITTTGSNAATYFTTYDGNGNITQLVNANDGTFSAQYEYGPFGEPLRVSGAMAGQNPFRFSTKYTDDETGLLYYGYRYYNPSTGRWINRDPIAENGGLNLYGFVWNNPCCFVDLLGLSCCSSADINKAIAEYTAKARAKTVADLALVPAEIKRKGYSTGREWGGRICCKAGKATGTEPQPGEWNKSEADLFWVGQVYDHDKSPKCEQGAKEVGFYHSHTSSNDFSPGDKTFVKGNNKPLGLMGPDGVPSVLNPAPGTATVTFPSGVTATITGPAVNTTTSIINPDGSLR